MLLFFKAAQAVRKSKAGKFSLEEMKRQRDRAVKQHKAVCHAYCEHSSNFLGHCWTDLKCMSDSPALKIKDSLDSIPLSLSLLDNELGCDEAYTEHLVGCKQLRIPLS